jgi:hypothetical protein
VRSLYDLRQSIAGRLSPPRSVCRQADLSAARGTLSRAATLVDQRADDRPVATRFAETQAAKTFTNDAACRVVGRALAVAGDAGYMSGHPLTRAYRGVRGPAPSCTRSAPTASTTSSAASRSARTRRSTSTPSRERALQPRARRRDRPRASEGAELDVEWRVPRAPMAEGDSALKVMTWRLVADDSRSRPKPHSGVAGARRPLSTAIERCSVSPTRWSSGS